ncbi:MAG: AAA family ATPase [Candidatus Uhrbacteria bacterium]
MYLEKLEVQGFKTFAQKTVLKFPEPKKDRHTITSIVGPNGSGKSNLSDAIRWALGEQSLKLLRGKKSEDIIFSGSSGRSRSGFAQVIMTFNNEDGAMPIEFPQVEIKRYMDRSGGSEYRLNGKVARLADIHLLLAQAGVGQKSYAVIGQGMVDHILVSSPEERKGFFDDATGVKQFQLKRHESMLKLRRTYENLEEVELILNEIGPRLRSLKRQVSRLAKREEVEIELRELQTNYYRTLWLNLQDQLKVVRVNFDKLDIECRTLEAKTRSQERKAAEIESTEQTKEMADQDQLALQNRYRLLQSKRSELRDKEYEIQKEIELKKVRAEAKWTPLPLSEIIQELETITKEQEKLIEQITSATPENLATLATSLNTRSSKLLTRLRKPAPETIKPDQGLVLDLKDAQKKRAELEDELRRLEKQMETHAKTEKEQKTELFEIGRDLREKQNQLHQLSNQRNQVQIELARLEEREHNLNREIDEEAGELEKKIKSQGNKINTDQAYPQIQKLKYKLEMIGGIDPETLKEHDEISERHEFLDTQIKDLRGAVKSTEKIIDELDKKIHAQSEEAFKKINREFQRYFKLLFGGGSCSLVKMTRDQVVEDQEEENPEADQREGVTERLQGRRDTIVGIDIQATPPGKKMKALNLLSGGERSLTSIALVAAIMATNPSPFVVLDEVDAALDEANTLRYAAIVDELAKHTQFIIITHNRASMEKSDVLYGVTMGDDGVSHLLSVSLEGTP